MMMKNLYDLKCKRMVQEIQWKTRRHMNDPKYIGLAIVNQEMNSIRIV